MKYFQYYVEGYNDKKLVSVLKTIMRCIVPGRVEVLNVVQEKITKVRVMQLKHGTTVILIFDTDAGNIKILRDNIDFLKKSGVVNEIYCITQVKNLEDELVRSCKIKQIRELTGSTSNSDFKSDMLKETDSVFYKKLVSHGFDFWKLWRLNDPGTYKDIKNDADKIRVKSHTAE